MISLQSTRTYSQKVARPTRGSGEERDKERVIVSTKKESTKRKTTSTAVDDLTSEEREAVTIVFHQFETGLREGTIFTKVKKKGSREGEKNYKTNLGFSSLLSLFKLYLIGWCWWLEMNLFPVSPSLKLF